MFSERVGSFLGKRSAMKTDMAAEKGGNQVEEHEVVVADPLMVEMPVLLSLRKAEALVALSRERGMSVNQLLHYWIEQMMPASQMGCAAFPARGV
jgi:hypothetical protein